MKTQKIAFTGIMASILMASGAAFADETATALTTKGYVDAGLRAVYGIASAAADKNLSNISETGAANVSAKGTVDLTKDDYAEGTIGEALVNINSTVSTLDSTVGTLGSTVSGLETTVAGKADASDLTTLSNKVNNVTTGLDSKASQASLTALQQQVDALDTSAYEGENGVIVSDHKVKLAVPTAAATDGNAYVYKNGAWAALDVESTWDPSVLTTP